MSQKSDILVQRKKQILSAAQEVFSQYGYARASMDAIAAEAGISKGNIYNYFPSKRDLFMQLFAELLLQEINRGKGAFDATDTATQRLSHMLDSWFEQLPRYQEIGRLILEFSVEATKDSNGEQSITEWFSRLYSEGLEQIGEVIRLGIQRGEFRDNMNPFIASSLIMAMVDGVIFQTIRNVLQVDELFLTGMKNGILAALKAEARHGNEMPEVSTA